MTNIRVFSITFHSFFAADTDSIRPNHPFRMYIFIHLRMDICGALSACRAITPAYQCNFAFVSCHLTQAVNNEP